MSLHLTKAETAMRIGRIATILMATGVILAASASAGEAAQHRPALHARPVHSAGQHPKPSDAVARPEPVDVAPAAPEQEAEVPLPRANPLKVPLPLRRPVERTVVVTPPTLTACQTRLADAGALFTALGDTSGPGECGATDIVELRRITAEDGPITVTPPAKLRCEVAESIMDFVSKDLAAAVSALGSIRALENADSYDCRPRNGIPGARTSEHGHANALDISGLRLKNGRTVRPTDDTLSHDIRLAMRTAACNRFNTVLGPGSDGFHEDHIHVDLIQRPSKHRLCQWDLHDTVPADAAVAKNEHGKAVNDDQGKVAKADSKAVNADSGKVAKVDSKAVNADNGNVAKLDSGSAKAGQGGTVASDHGKLAKAAQGKPASVPLPAPRPAINAEAASLNTEAASNEHSQQSRRPRHRNARASLHQSRRFSRYWPFGY